MRFCPFCSAENADELAVCQACGRRLPPLPPRRAGSKGPPTGISLPPRAGATAPPPIPPRRAGNTVPPPTSPTSTVTQAGAVGPAGGLTPTPTITRETVPVDRQTTP